MSHLPPLPSADLPDLELATALATGAGEVLLELRRTVNKTDNPVDDKALRAAGDLASQEWLAAALHHARPQDAVLSEEARDNSDRLTASRVWIIDPLDGTREFAERTGSAEGQDGAASGETDSAWRDDFAVHIALWERGMGLTVGAVALPARGQVFTTGNVKSQRIPRTERPLRLAASRTRPPAFLTDLAATGAVELVPMGSAGVKVLAVVTGLVDGYLHAGGQYEWDSAAPVAVAQAAGLVATRLAGTPLQYNQPDPWLPDLFVAPPEVAPQLRKLLAGLPDEAA